MKINKDYLDTKLRCPISGGDVIVRFIPSSLYERYYVTYPFIFEVDKKIKTKNDISTAEYTEPGSNDILGEFN